MVSLFICFLVYWLAIFVVLFGVSVPYVSASLLFHLYVWCVGFLVVGVLNCSFFGFLICWFLGFKVPWLMYWFIGFRSSWFLGLEVSKLHYAMLQTIHFFLSERYRPTSII